MENKDKIYDPLFVELFRVALPQMEKFQFDLGHDTLRLARAVPGERYLWGVRPTGTELRLLDEDPSARSAEINDCLRRYAGHRWYMLEIASVRLDGYCAGTITPLSDPMHHEPPNHLAVTAPEMRNALLALSGKLSALADADSDEQEMHIRADMAATIDTALQNSTYTGEDEAVFMQDNGA